MTCIVSISPRPGGGAGWLYCLGTIDYGVHIEHGSTVHPVLDGAAVVTENGALSDTRTIGILCADLATAYAITLLGPRLRITDDEEGIDLDLFVRSADVGPDANRNGEFVTTLAGVDQ